MRVTQRMLDGTLQEYDKLVEIYKKTLSSDEKRDWRTYEQRLALRIKTASSQIEPVIEEAHATIKLPNTTMGKPSDVPITKKVLILLLKDIFKLSNRKMANMLAMFSVLTGIDISYKTVERAYSDPIARMIIHNAFVILMKRKGIESSDASGDGTGYGLTVTKHYRNEREKELKEANKSNNKSASSCKQRKRRPFVYAFALMDLDTKMYIGYGTSIRSEKEAFDKALAMAKSIGIAIDSVRLDKYYSFKSITKYFGKGTKIYVIPKSNATVGPFDWNRILESFVVDTFDHMSEYYRRNNSESGFSVDKRTSGWQVWQRREERIDTAIMCKGLWHNFMLMD